MAFQIDLEALTAENAELQSRMQRISTLEEALKPGNKITVADINIDELDTVANLIDSIENEHNEIYRVQNALANLRSEDIGTEDYV